MRRRQKRKTAGEVLLSAKAEAAAAAEAKGEDISGAITTGAVVMIQGLASAGSLCLNGKTGIVVGSKYGVYKDEVDVLMYGIRMDASGSVEHFVDTNLRRCRQDERQQMLKTKEELELEEQSEADAKAKEEADQQAEAQTEAQREFLQFVCGKNVQLVRHTTMSAQPLAVSDDYGAGDASIGLWGARIGESTTPGMAAAVQGQLAAASSRAAAQLGSMMPELPPELYPLRDGVVEAGSMARGLAVGLAGGVVEGVLDTMDAIEGANGAGHTSAERVRKGIRSSKAKAKAKVHSTVGWLRRRRLRELFSEHDPGEDSNGDEGLSVKDLLSVLHSPKERMSSQSAPSLLPGVNRYRAAPKSTPRPGEDTGSAPAKRTLRLPFLKQR
jgi:hypothetical protein